LIPAPGTSKIRDKNKKDCEIQGRHDQPQHEQGDAAYGSQEPME